MHAKNIMWNSLSEPVSYAIKRIDCALYASQLFSIQFLKSSQFSFSTRCDIDSNHEKEKQVKTPSKNRKTSDTAKTNSSLTEMAPRALFLSAHKTAERCSIFSTVAIKVTKLSRSTAMGRLADHSTIVSSVWGDIWPPHTGLRTCRSNISAQTT